MFSDSAKEAKSQVTAYFRLTLAGFVCKGDRHSCEIGCHLLPSERRAPRGDVCVPSPCRDPSLSRGFYSS